MLMSLVCVQNNCCSCLMKSRCWVGGTITWLRHAENLALSYKIHWHIPGAPPNQGIGSRNLPKYATHYLMFPFLTLRQYMILFACVNTPCECSRIFAFKSKKAKHVKRPTAAGYYVNALIRAGFPFVWQPALNRYEENVACENSNWAGEMCVFME